MAPERSNHLQRPATDPYTIQQSLLNRYSSPHSERLAQVAEGMRAMEWAMVRRSALADGVGLTEG